MRTNGYKPLTKRSLSDRRGALLGDGTLGINVGSYSKTSGILSSIGRLGLIVLGGALVLATVLLRRDSKIVSEGSTSTAASIRGAVDADRTKATAGSDSSITLQTPHGSIVITLRPDLSPESTQYIHSLLNSKSCTPQSCRLYRAEKPGILQGILKSGDDDAVERVVGVVKPNAVFGRCPDEYKDVKQDCPEHDRNCGCHGPIMVKGDVGWAAGTAGGPDFFINTYERPAKHWGNQHTVWGHVSDQDSLATIAKYWELPVKNVGGMHMLMEEVPFRVVASGGKISRMVDSLRGILN